MPKLTNVEIKPFMSKVNKLLMGMNADPDLEDISSFMNIINEVYNKGWDDCESYNRSSSDTNNYLFGPDR